LHILSPERQLILLRRFIVGLEALDREIEALKVEYEKFTRGNNSAGTRARKVLQNIKKAAQELRDEIQSKRKAE
jgi:archaellum component FlaC